MLTSSAASACPSWRRDDIVLWDNRCTMHQALADFDQTQRRHMERTTVLGIPSGYAVASA
jgi:taurine dioxygenase